MSDGFVESKWDCTKCTYLNHEAAILCTMCRTSRNYINYLPSTSEACIQSSLTFERWECPACTYLNYRLALSCCICSRRRPEHLHVHSIEEDTCSLKAQLDLDEALNKWNCSVCTYKNWPGVKSCAICRTVRGVFENTTQEVSNDEETVLEEDRNKETESIEPGFNSDSVKGSCRAAHSERSSQSEIFVELPPLQRYLLLLQKAVDTGCASFLRAVYQLICLEDDNFDRILSYICVYREPTRKMTALESNLFNQFAEFNNTIFYNRSLVDILDFRDPSYVANISLDCYKSSAFIQFPGSVSSDGSDEIHARIREDMFDDLDLCRMMNSSVIFNVPEAVYDHRARLNSADKPGILMDFDENQLMYTVCGSDTNSPTTGIGQKCYAPLILRNRGGGHSLVDAVSQALWGVIDTNNLLRSAVYRTLCAQEKRFRSYWNSWISKFELNLTETSLQRCWEDVLDCHEAGSSMEQIHILVLAQILNRPIIVLPIVSSKTNRNWCKRSSYIRHPMEGFYPQLADFNKYRLCYPLFLGFANGSFHAIVLPPPQRSPMIGQMRAEQSRRVFRYLRCPKLPLEFYVVFSMTNAEIAEFIKYRVVVDVDSEGNHWFYHSSFLVPKDSEIIVPMKDSGTVLWHRWMKSHFPRKKCDATELVEPPSS